MSTNKLESSWSEVDEATINSKIVSSEEELLSLGTNGKTKPKRIFWDDELRGGSFTLSDNPEADDGGIWFNGYRRDGVDYVKPEWFGAVGDGITDDTIALKKLETYSSFTKIPIVVTANKSYICTLPLTFQYVDFNCQGVLIFKGIDNPDEMSSFLTLVGYRNKFTVNIEKNVESDWVNDLSGGVCFAGEFNDITIKQIKNFRTGIVIGREIKQFGWNTVYFNGVIWNAQIGILIDNHLASTVCWVNENLFVMFSCQIHSDSIHYATTEMITYVKANGANNSNNKNTFLKPTFEAHDRETTILDFYQISGYVVINPRNELSSNKNLYLKTYNSSFKLDGLEEIEESGVARTVEFYFNQDTSAHRYIDSLSLEDFGYKDRNIKTIFDLNIGQKLENINGLYGITTGELSNLSSILSNPISKMNDTLEHTYSSVDITAGALVQLNNSNIVEIEYECLIGSTRYEIQFLDINGTLLTETSIGGNIYSNIDFNASISYALGDGYKVWSGSSNMTSKKDVIGVDTSIIKYIRIGIFGATSTLNKFSVKTVGDATLITTTDSVFKDGDLSSITNILSSLPTTAGAVGTWYLNNGVLTQVQ